MRGQPKPGTFVWYHSGANVGLAVVVKKRKKRPDSTYTSINWIIPPSSEYTGEWYFRRGHPHCDYITDLRFLTPVEEQPK
jgi:hypothetical protein